MITPKRLLFLSSPIVCERRSVIPVTKVSVSDMPTILKTFVSMVATSEAAILTDRGPFLERAGDFSDS